MCALCAVNECSTKPRKGKAMDYSERPVSISASAARHALWNTYDVLLSKVLLPGMTEDVQYQLPILRELQAVVRADDLALDGSVGYDYVATIERLLAESEESA
jgi:hypothetical protein